MDLLTLTLAASLYTDQSVPNWSYKLTYGDPWYIFGQLETPTVRVLGQSISDSTVYSVGFGARKYVGDFFMFAELGYGYIDNSVKTPVEHEVTYTHLVGNHNVFGRPVPVDPRDYESSWELEGGALGAFGGGYKWSDNLAISVAYRPFFGKEHLEIWDVDRRARDGGYWQETYGRDLSSFQVGIQFSY